jgi:hypothetical protein
MFSFLRRSQPGRPTAAMMNALASDGLPPGMDAATLQVVEHTGSYSGRRVTNFRVFDPLRAAERSIQVRTFNDLDSRPDLVLGAGHVERDGAVVLIKRSVSTASATPNRSQASRADHADDERVVFPNSSATRL